MTKILLHTCCAPCASFVFENLIEQEYSPTGFFFNPNIYPVSEYEKRRDEAIDFFSNLNYPLVLKETDFKDWFNYISGLENEKEGGKRCEKCFKFRLIQTAKYAKENGFDCFTTVMSISPHKNSVLLNKIGKKIEEEYGIKFLEADFKKNNGFKKSLELSKKYGLYRQNYCGCKFSIR